MDQPVSFDDILEVETGRHNPDAEFCAAVGEAVLEELRMLLLRKPEIQLMFLGDKYVLDLVEETLQPIIDKIGKFRPEARIKYEVDILANRLNFSLLY